MRTLCIDYEYAYEPAEFASFDSDASLLDYDLVIWDPKETLFNYKSWQGSHRGLPSLNESQSARYLSDVPRRRKDFQEFVQLGRVLVVIVRPPIDLYYDTGQRSYSGTGRNRATTRHIAESDLFSALPVDFATRKSRGKAIEFVGVGRYASFWKENKDLLTYDAVIETDSGTPLFKVRGTNSVVGAVTQFDSGGAILFLPAPSMPANEDETDVDDARASAFLRSVETLARGISHIGDIEPLPAWTSRFALPTENDAQNEVVKRQSAVERARARLGKAQQSLSDLQQLKHLVTANGRQLELVVKKAFEDMGGNVIDPEPGRDDWVVQFPESDAVVEVKGKKSSAAEADAAQLEKWVASYFEEHDKHAKGILVVNGWREKPIDSRAQPVYPDQMLKYSESRGHCLLSGLQVLSLQLGVRSGALEAGAARKLILETVGSLSGHDSWEDIFERIQIEEAED